MCSLTFTVGVIICYFTAVYVYCLLILYCFYHSLVNKDFHILDMENTIYTFAPVVILSVGCRLVAQWNKTYDYKIKKKTY